MSEILRAGQMSQDRAKVFGEGREGGDSFAKQLRKVTVSLVTPVRPSVRSPTRKSAKPIRRIFGKSNIWVFDVLLTVHLSIFISVFNQLDAQNLFHNKFYFMPLHETVTYRCDDTRGCVMQF